MATRRINPLLVVGFLLAGGIPAHAAGPVVLKMGTLAPQKSPWHNVLEQMGQDWARMTDGQVRLHIYAGGTLGEEADMITRVRVGQLHAVAISGAGMPRIEPAVGCLQIPMMFDSYEELDYVRDRIAPRLEKMLEEKGFIVLNWGDAGWVHFFTRTPARTPDDIRRMKLFITAGDTEMLELYKAAGMKPVPLATTDILPALRTGMIEAFDVPPLAALLNQWFGLATNMVEVRWAPLIGATLVDKRAWERIPAGLRPKLFEAAQSAGQRFRGDIRKLSEDAVAAMQKRGLKVVKLDREAVAVWRSEAEAIYPKLRGRVIPADLFDEVRRLRDEHRSRATGKR